MKYSECKIGRTFIIRLEHGDRIPDVIENFAAEKEIDSALVTFLGGADKNSKVITGPVDGDAAKPEPVITELSGASESAGIGTLFCNEKGKPVLHMHSAFGRGEKTITGCTRAGVDIWLIGEVCIIELLVNDACRKLNPDKGFELLEIE